MLDANKQQMKYSLQGQKITIYKKDEDGNIQYEGYTDSDGNFIPYLDVNENETHENENEVATPSTEPKMFSQEEVNKLISDRLVKQESRLFKKYGVNSRDDFDLMVGKSQQYDEMKSRFDDLVSQNSEMRERLLMIDNNIDPSQVDDLKYYFKGKGIELNDENLKSELTTHPAWVKKVDIKPVGVEHKPVNKVETEEEFMKRVFGI